MSLGFGGWGVFIFHNHSHGYLSADVSFQRPRTGPFRTSVGKISTVGNMSAASGGGSTVGLVSLGSVITRAAAAGLGEAVGAAAMESSSEEAPALRT